VRERRSFVSDVPGQTPPEVDGSPGTASQPVAVAERGSARSTANPQLVGNGDPLRLAVTGSGLRLSAATPSVVRTAGSTAIGIGRRSRSPFET
jgi:hypothetical protein